MTSRTHASHSRIQLRRGRASQWADANPVLHSGEPGYEIDTNKTKIGDGITHWNDLPYQGSELPPDQSDLLAHINAAEPHPVYDDGPSLALIYQNAKV